MKNNSKLLKAILATVFWLLLWELASLLVSESLSIFLPSPFSVIKAFINLLPNIDFLKAAGVTLLRIFVGFVSGAIVGILVAILTTRFYIADILISPALRVARTVPVVSFIILAFLFVSVDNLPILISFLMVLPLVWQTVSNAIKNVDEKLLEMANVYHISYFKSLKNIIFPEIKNEIISSLINGIGFAWKSGIAAEVISSPKISLGRNIFRAKANLQFDEVYALTLTVIILSLIFEITLKTIFQKRINRREIEND